MKIHKALHNNHWADLIYPLETREEIREYIELWDMIYFQDRDINAEEEIIWRWIKDGEYTTKSAYTMLFVGHKKNIYFHPIRKAKTETKCRFFA